MAAPTRHRQYPPPTIPVDLPPGLRDWHLTEHAKHRAGERLFSLTEILVTAEMPEVVIPSPANRDVEQHRKGDCIAVVNSALRIVLTVKDANAHEDSHSLSRVERAQGIELDDGEPTIRVVDDKKLNSLTARILNGIQVSPKKDEAPPLSRQDQIWLRTVVLPKLKSKPDTWAKLTIRNSLVFSHQAAMTLAATDLGVQMQMKDTTVYVKYQSGRE